MTYSCPIIKKHPIEDMNRLEIQCHLAEPSTCGIDKTYETRKDGRYCGLNFIEDSKEKLIRSRADLSVLVYIGNLLKKFNTSLYSSELISSKHIRYFKEFGIDPTLQKSSIIRTEAFKDFELRPEPKYPEFSGSESSKPCALNVFLSRLRTMVSKRFPDMGEVDGRVVDLYYNEEISKLKTHPLMFIDTRVRQAMEAGTLIHHFSFGDVYSSDFVDYDLIGSKSRDHCEFSFGHKFDTGDFTLECRLTPDVVFPLAKGFVGEVDFVLGIDGKLSTAPKEAYHGQARQMVLYEEGMNSQTGILSKFKLQYAKAIVGKGIRVKNAYRTQELREDRLNEVKFIVNETAIALPKFIEDIRSIKEWQPGRLSGKLSEDGSCARCKDMGCFLRDKCSHENLRSLVDRLDEAGFKQKDYKELRFASKIER